jgi:integrase
MARPSKTAPIDYANAHDLTAGLLERAACPDGRPFVLLKDADKKGLRLRVTLAGGKHWQFETRLRSGKLFTRALGEWPAVSIGDAQKEAHRLRGLTEVGTDPRELEQAQAEVKAAAAADKATQAAAVAALATADALTVREAWNRYMAERRPRWGERNYADHVNMTHEGGEARKRLSGVLTKPGPLAPIMALRLVDLDAKAVEVWAIKEAKDRPARVRLALRLLKAFLRWAAAESDLSDKVDPAAASAKKAREAAGKAKPKDDVLERGQLSAWFGAVRGIPNAVTAAYLQTLLMTGARPGEVLALRWADLNTQWMSVTIRDKVEGERQIPLTPFVWSLLSGLPRRNDWVFSSSRAVSLDLQQVKRRERYHSARDTAAPIGDAAQVSESGRLMDPDIAHRKACIAASLEGLTLHGLRRSFASLTEWLEVPAGVVAQIQGHKPSATAEKHYKRRPLDLLAVHHKRIEAWILEQARVTFDSAAPAGLRVVA